jgi:hypothetical protein
MIRLGKLTAFSLLTSAFTVTTLAATLKPAPLKVVFLGDATTYNWGLPANSNAFQANPKWMNKGLTGQQTSSRMLARFQTDVVNNHPAVVHILGGSVDVALVNDANRAFLVETFENNIIAMVAQAAHAHIKVILGTIPPLLSASMVQTPQSWVVFQPTPLQELNAWILSYGETNNIPVINYHDTLCACVGSTNPSRNGFYPMMASNGTTPAPSGFTAITTMVQTAINTFELTMRSGFLANPGSITRLPQGQSIQFTAYGVYNDGIPRALLNPDSTGAVGKWSSSNSSVMLVGYNGEAFAFAPGEATISFTSADGVPFSSWVMTVEAAPF